MPTSRSRWLFALLFLAFVGPAFSNDDPEPAHLRLFILRTTDGAPQHTEISFDAAGRGKLEEIFSDHFGCGGGYGKAGEVVQCLESMGDAVPGFQAAPLMSAMGRSASLSYQIARRLLESEQARNDLATIGGWGSSRVLDVQLHLADAAEDVGRGHKLRVWDSEGTFHEVTFDGSKTLEEIAAEHGITKAKLLRQNSTTVEVWPHCQANACQEEVHGRPLAAAKLRLGEKAIETKKKTFDDAWATMLHEAAHASDDAPSPRENYRYGKDRDHYLSEIISPHNAFSEGWAEFIPATLDPENKGYMIAGVVAEDPPDFHKIEKDLDIDAEGDRYDWHRRNEVTPSQLLSNEVIVSRILYKTRPLFDSLTPMGKAFRDTNSVRGRHIADYLSRLASQVVQGDSWHGVTDTERWGPKLRGMIDVLKAEANLSDEQAWRMLRSGNLPDGRTGGAAPGPVAPVRVAGPPAPEAEAPSSGGGILGMD